MDSLKLTMHPLYIHIILMWVTLRMVENVIPHCTKYILILTDAIQQLAAPVHVLPMQAMDKRYYIYM